MILPVGTRFTAQELVLVTKGSDGRVTTRQVLPVRFVPLTGDHPAIMSERLPARSIALVSGAALANEVLLTRYFAVVHWHHFADMMISLALLGFGASGTFITLARRGCSRAVRAGVRREPGGLWCARGRRVRSRRPPLPFQAEQLLWDPVAARVARDDVPRARPALLLRRQRDRARAARWRARAGRVYAADLVGAGIGSLLDPRAAVCRAARNSRSRSSPARARPPRWSRSSNCVASRRWRTCRRRRPAPARRRAWRVAARRTGRIQGA